MKTFFFVVLIFSSLKVLAGAETHGGGVFVCRDTNGKIKNGPLAVELIDLWEGMVPYGLDIKRNDKPWTAQIGRAMERLKKWDSPLYIGATFFLTEIREENPYEFRPISDPDVVINPQIVEPPFLKRGCPVEGVVAYNDSGEILRVNKKLLQRLPPTDLGALYVHEAVCRSLRYLAGDDRDVSDRCRLIVAYLFSEEPIPDFTVNLPQEKLFCANDNLFFSFYLFKDENGNLRARFKTIDGNPLSYIQDINVDNLVTKTTYAHKLPGGFSMTTGARPYIEKSGNYWQYTILDWTTPFKVDFFEKKPSFPVIHCN